MTRDEPPRSADIEDGARCRQDYSNFKEGGELQWTLCNLVM